MLAVRVDTFPVVVTTFGESFDESDLSVFIDGQEDVIARQLPYVSIIDTSALVTLPSALVREGVIDFTRKHSAAVTELCLSSELVVRSVAVRAALAAMNWIVPSTSRLSLHASLRPAVSRALDVVWTNQLETPTPLLAYHDEIMIAQSIPPGRPTSGSFSRRALESSIQGLLRRARKSDEG